MKNQIINTIISNEISDFIKAWTEIKNDLTEKDKQGLLVEILDNYYSEKRFSFFVKVFDKIIDSKVSLNFNIDHWAPTFLSLAIHQSSRQLFDYFLRKGANINFIGDLYAFESEATIKHEIEELQLERYSTCLDFAELKLSDLLTVDYNFSVPDTDEEIRHWSDIDSEEEIKIRKTDYYYLVAQSQYLHDLIHTDRLVEHIISAGGKTYRELKNR